MDSIADLAKKVKLPTKRDPHLHSAAHVLADELATKLSDPKHFALYLKLALTHPHDVLKRLMGQVLEGHNITNKGKLFSYLVKQYNQSSKEQKK